jgi:hypothetical protein
MTVRRLISILEKMPKDADVCHLYDGEKRGSIDLVYVSKSESVITAGYGDHCYSDDARPKNAPTEKEEPFWYLPTQQNQP